MGFSQTQLFSVSEQLFENKSATLTPSNPRRKEDVPRKEPGGTIIIARPVGVKASAERWSKNGSRCKKCGTQFVSFMSFVTQLFHVRQAFERAKHSDWT